MPSRHSTTLRGVVYCRMSSAKQEGSIEQQQDWARTACAREQVEPIAEFIDEAKAGHDTGKRTAFRRMLDFCRDEGEAGRPVDVVVCWSTSRFSRADSHETGWFLWEFRKAGVRWMLTEVDGLIDFNSDVHRLVMGVKQEASNHPYVKELAQSALRGKLDNARKGLWNGGRPPFGYRVVHEVLDPGADADEGGRRRRRYRARLVADPDTGPLVKELFRRYATGTESLSSLCRWLDSTGVRPPRSRPGDDAALWRRHVVRRILRSEKYLGSLLYGQERKGKFFCLVDQEVTERGNAEEEGRVPFKRPNSHEPLTDRDTFDAVQAALAGQKRRTRPTARAVFPLLGLLTCGHCGSVMAGQVYKSRVEAKRPRSDGKTFFRCGRYGAFGRHSGCKANRIEEGALLAAILRKLKERVFDPAILNELWQILERREREGRRPVEASVGRLSADLARLEDEMRRASQRYLVEADEALAALHRENLGRLQARKEALEKELAQAKLPVAPGPALDPKAVVARALELARRLDEALGLLDPQRLRLVLLQIIDRVELWFRHEERAQRSRSFFVRGLVFLRPGLLVDLIRLLPTSPHPC